MHRVQMTSETITPMMMIIMVIVLTLQRSKKAIDRPQSKSKFLISFL